MESFLTEYHIDFLPFQALLRETPSLIAGSSALALYLKSNGIDPGYEPGDIDIWIERELKNVTNLCKALKEFGAPLRNISEEDFMNKDTIYQIGVEPVRVDIMSDLFGMNFKQAWKARTKTRYADVPVGLIGLNDLIKSKEKAGRKQDKLDIEKLALLKRPKTK